MGVVGRVRDPSYTLSAFRRRRAHPKRTNEPCNHWYADKDGGGTNLESLAYGNAFFLFLRFRNLEGE
jgi:hypothetical protein